MQPILKFLQDWRWYAVRPSAFIQTEGLYQVRYFFWSCLCQEERFCNWVFQVIRKISLCCWYVFLEFLAYWCNVIIKIFCNIFWLTYSFAVYEMTIRFPCIGFWFTIDYFIDPIPNCFTVSFVIFKIFIIVRFFSFLWKVNNNVTILFVETEF